MRRGQGEDGHGAHKRDPEYLFGHVSSDRGAWCIEDAPDTER
jgi:hypothetical protein